MKQGRVIVPFDHVQYVVLKVFSGHVPWFTWATDAETVALANGVVHQALMFSHYYPVEIPEGLTKGQASHLFQMLKPR